MSMAKLDERSNKPVNAAADVLEMAGMVEMADELRKHPGLSVRFPRVTFRNQGSVDELAENNSDVPFERIVWLREMRDTLVLVAVGDLEALVMSDVADEIKRVLYP